MQTLEKEVENTTVRRKRSEQNSENKSKEKKNKGKIILKTILGIIITGILIGLFLLYGPITKFREWYITSAMTTMTHQYLATWFYSDETINDVLSKNTVVEVDGITDTNQINTDDKSKEEADLSNLNEYERAVLEKDKNHPEYKLINIKGKGSHGAYPHAGIDPINIGVHIHLALQELIAREADPNAACVLTIGKFQGGAAANIIPDTAVLEGTLRTNNAKERKKLVARIKEVAELTAAVYGGSAQIESLSSVPPLVCDETLTEEIIGYMREMSIPGFAEYPGVSASASEDFATIAERVPSTFMYLSAGYMDERGAYSAHNPKVRFNEDVCPIGASCLAYCAVQWLKNH